ncbi:MAG: SpoIID [uncultured Nocardioidaceae bacterium]|uniref:SpoIID n=1 Tax=uncultured Nocardioidaceae bacterium TaxID=253824 RepID=A0A6J4LFU6_9ACTN|nr:MAG: SpoIID [uncultured Nocardioidaceae bacterium]
MSRFTRASVGALTAVLTGGLLLTSGAGPAGAVATDQRYPVPADGTYTVSGHGYGHGHGMSQHGAQGAALEGLEHQQILDFYYPGTELGKARGKIRVLLTADTGSDLVVGARRGLRLKDRGSGTAYDLPRGQGATRWRLSVDGGRDVVHWYDGSWHRWRPGGRDALAGEGQLSAGGRPLTLYLPSGSAQYRGTLRHTAPSEGSTDRNTVNVLGLDSYVRGVVPSEIPASWKPEAVQAQSVAARTYGAWDRSQDPSHYHHICDTTSCQVYKGVAGEHPLGDAAVAATSRQVLRNDGAPAFTQFSASSGGWTSAGSAPYLVAKKDPYDNWSGNDVHNWSLSLSASAISRAYPAIGRLRTIRVTSRDGNGEWNGRVWSMRLIGSQGRETVSGDTFRYRFGLRSTWFSFR